MFTIVIGEEEQYEEYGRRLVRYLESHWKGPLRIFRHTQPQSLLQTEVADCYLLGEEYREAILGDEEVSGFYRHKEVQNREIVISNSEKKGCFCRYHAPAELISLIYDKIPEHSAEMGFRRDTMVPDCQITGIFSPVFHSGLKRIATSYMHSGDLYLGMDDMNDFHEPGGNMGDLCYFILLKDEEILHHIKEIAEEFQEMYFVEAPEVYFDLLELRDEEYQWFFDRLRREKEYPEVFVGIGCGVLGQGEMLQFFDRIILLDSREDRYQHAFCNHMEKAIQAGGILFHGVVERRYREDVLHESL